MAPTTSNTLHKIIAWVASSALAIIIIVFNAGGFVSETKTANKDVKILSDRFNVVEKKVDRAVSLMEKRAEIDSIKKIAEKEAELKYKIEVHKAVESCVLH